ncbi:MAG: hypothetical protein KGH59_02245 [Candidatus Micrarchaeota archaeon]|nr:hypothetical protein [Candidatus Micrarchaeota archaeon]
MKLQFLSFDVIFAMVIFSSALLLLAFTWYSINTQIGIVSGTSVQNMQLQLDGVSEGILGQGYPHNWNSVVDPTNSVTWANVSIGLGSGVPGTLSQSKVFTFSAMASNSYASTKAQIGTAYDYYIVIQGSNFNIPIGKPPSSPVGGVLNGATVATTTKSVTINGQPAKMQIYIWTNSSFGLG